MIKEIYSEGDCCFCNKTFGKADIKRHLRSHLAQMEKAEDKKAGSSYYLKVEAKYGKGLYFLYLWVSSNVKLEDIDSFLRAIWLECCGHMSTFAEVGSKNSAPALGFSRRDEDRDEYGCWLHKSSLAKVVDCVGIGGKILYEYDMGSTTELVITVLDELQVQAPKKVVLLSRNNPLEVWCDSCGVKPAVTICEVHAEYFCPACAKKHARKCEDFDDYAQMDLVNSPRTGVCGYNGGSIDTERDGIFKPKN